MTERWLDLMVKDSAYREFIDVKPYKDGNKKMVIEGPVPMDMFLWILNQGVSVKVVSNA